MKIKMHNKLESHIPSQMPLFKCLMKEMHFTCLIHNGGIKNICGLTPEGERKKNPRSIVSIKRFKD